MTKLPKPIVLTITHVENAIITLVRADILIGNLPENRQQIAWNVKPGEMCEVINAALLAQGIDWKTWEPPQPLKVGPHEVSANPDGSVKVGCTTVDRPTLEAIVKLSSEAMGKSEPEWPKYYASPFEENGVYVAKSETEVFWTQHGKEHLQNGSNAWFAEKPKSFKPLTPLQAREILEAKG